MQFSIVALLSLAAFAVGSPASSKAGVKARQNVGAGAAVGGAGAAAGGEAAGGGPTVQQPAMTDQQGNVVNFDAANVYLAGQDAGL